MLILRPRMPLRAPHYSLIRIYASISFTCLYEGEGPPSTPFCQGSRDEEVGMGMGAYELDGLATLVSYPSPLPAAIL